MKRTYFDTGKEFSDTTDKKNKLEEAIKTIEWYPVPPPKLPLSQGMGLNALVRRWGKDTDKIGFGVISTNGHCYSLLAFRNNYSEGDVRRVTIYSVDTGCESINVAADEETLEDLKTA